MRPLDACAAPGGKTTHLAEPLWDQGELWAVDRSESRLQRLLHQQQWCPGETAGGDGFHASLLAPPGG